MVSSQPLVSIIIPTYNGEKRIAKTLESLIAQDYSNIEIIVVDDVSTDNTVSTARRVLEASGRNFRIIQRTVNGRQSASRNTGLDAANGEYVIFFDHDDLAEKNFVSELCAEAETKNADIVFCGIRHFWESSSSFTEEAYALKDTQSPLAYLEAWASRKIHLWSVWNFIFRKNFLTEHKLRFPEKCRLGEDTEFVLKAVASASKMSSIKEILYIYVHHSEQTSVVYDNMFPHILLSRLRAGRFVARHVKNRKIRRYILNYYLPDAIVKQLTIHAENGDYEHYRRMIKTLKHRKIHELLLSSYKFLFSRPELFFKSLILLYAPNFYYRLRKGGSNK